MKNFYTRQKHGRNFWYYDENTRLKDKAVLARINSLVIPPAWQHVQISKSPKSKIQARGIDRAHRSQAIYHADYRAQQDRAKFERILSFAEKLPSLREHIDHDLRKHNLTKDKVLACIVKLMDEAYFRVGNESYAKQHQTYGITTLRKKHTDIKATKVSFDFIGKSGKQQQKTITNRTVAKLMKELDELPGYEAFQYIDENGLIRSIHSSDVNEYIKQFLGEEFTAKDFRTWGGTMLATSQLILEKQTSSEKERKKAITRCIKKVARQLGNTPAVAKSSYIDPRVIESYLDSTLLKSYAASMKSKHDEKYFKPEERFTLTLLQSAS